MTNKPEQPRSEEQSVPLSERLLRVRNAFIELELARYSVGLQAYSPDEVEAAYGQARAAQLESRAALDVLGPPIYTRDGVDAEHKLKETELRSDEHLEGFLKDWLSVWDR